MIRYLNSLKKLEENKKEYRRKSKLSTYLNDVLIGLILSDGYLERSRDRGPEVRGDLDPSVPRSSPTSAVRLTVSFRAKHSGYLLHLYDLFEPYTNSAPVSISVYNKKLNLIMKF